MAQNVKNHDRIGNDGTQVIRSSQALYFMNDQKESGTGGK